ncbi:MAG TPA: CPBP family intramembrane glutamic endopeptidase [Gemmataceae bacterium]|jgi:membrane protease YdiL (CAAX protease family)
MSHKVRPLLAWLVILGAVAFILWRNSTVSPLEKQKRDLVMMRLQSRYLVGLAELVERLLNYLNYLRGGSEREERFLNSKKSAREQLYKEAKANLNRGTYAQRLRFVVLAGELKGPDEAREQLRRLDQRYHERRGDPPAEEAEMARILGRIYAVQAEDPQAAASLPEDEQREVRERLDWFGDLALAPAGADDEEARAAVRTPAYRTALSVLVVSFVMLSVGVVGLALLVTLFVLWCLGRLRSGLTLGSPRHGVYVEAFALYMVLFLGLGVAVRYAIDGLALRHGKLALSSLPALGSLAALGWPVLCGVPWRQVRQDIGWHTGRRPWLEPFLGAGCYALALPMLILGVVLLLILTKLRDRLGWGPGEFDPSNAPSHPIIFWAGNAGWWVWLEVLFLAGVVAPVVEETMFRGVLYRYLREASAGLRPALSVCFSALVVSFLFAVIHPQGFLGVPPLMALALAFTLMREWRGTLLPPMIAHGINNAVATLLLFLMS